jgi:hypothetical protein
VQNKVQVYLLADALAQAGIDLWINREEIDPLDDFPARIRDGLVRSHALFAWYSPEYAQSSYCQKEFTAAWIAAIPGLFPCLQHSPAFCPGGGVVIPRYGILAA